MADTNSSTSSTIIPAKPADINTSSPYYLHPSDNLGALITYVLLKGDNYTEWATELSNSIQAKQKLGFINGTIPKPASDPELSRWLTTNSMLVGWICTSIDPKIRSTVSFVPETHKLWDNLKRRFSVTNGVWTHQLRDAISNCKQNGQSVIDYYGRLTKLWEELDNLKTTRSCLCDVASDIENEREEIHVHKFLFGLDESRFRTIRSQIIDEDPLPDINNVYSRVIREEQHNNTSHSTELKTEILGSLNYTYQWLSTNSTVFSCYNKISWSKPDMHALFSQRTWKLWVFSTSWLSRLVVWTTKDKHRRIQSTWWPWWSLIKLIKQRTGSLKLHQTCLQQYDHYTIAIISQQRSNSSASSNISVNQYIYWKIVG